MADWDIGLITGYLRELGTQARDDHGYNIFFLGCPSKHPFYYKLEGTVLVISNNMEMSRRLIELELAEPNSLEVLAEVIRKANVPSPKPVRGHIASAEQD